MFVSFHRFDTTMDAEKYAKQMTFGSLFAWIDHEVDPNVVIVEEFGLHHPHDDNARVESDDYVATLDEDEEFWEIRHKESDELVLSISHDPDENSDVIRELRAIQTY